MIASLFPAKYTSPSGTTIEFFWKEVKRSSGHAVATGDYPQYDGGDVLDLGHTIHQYPMTCLFYGEDFQSQSDKFFEALNEKGSGTLDHPRWGRLQVIATSISQDENYVDSIGRSTVDVTFIVTGEDLAPHYEVGDQSQLREKSLESEEILKKQIERTKPKTSVFNRFNNAILYPLKMVNQFLGKGWRLAGQWQSSFGALETSINAILNTPQHVVDIISAFLSPIKSVVKGERMLFMTGIVSLMQGKQEQQKVTAVETQDAIQASTSGTLVAQTMLTLTAINIAYDSSSELESREEAGNLLLQVKTIEQAYFSSMENLSSDVSINDDGMSWQLNYTMQKVFQVTKEAIIMRMSQLKMKQSKRLAHQMTLIELVHWLYGSIDQSQIDKLISINNLNDDEIFLLPAGKEVFYYA